MNQELKKIFSDAEGRYFDEAEEAALIGFADTVLQRLDTMRAVERAESAILDHVVQSVVEAFPDMLTSHGPETDQRVRRDQMMVLRYATFGAIHQDPGFVHDKLACWLRIIMYALCDVQQVIYGYEQLIVAVHQHLPADDAQLIERYVRVVLDEFQQHEERRHAA
jgi:hypothetical protein